MIRALVTAILRVEQFRNTISLSQLSHVMFIRRKFKSLDIWAQKQLVCAT